MSRKLKATLLSFCGITILATASAQVSPDDVHARLDRLEASIESGEDLSAIKRLQRAYGYYLDKGMWADLAELFTDDAVANYPAGVYIGKPSITRHLYLNVGAVDMGETGLGDNRLYNHMNLQPVVHLDPDTGTAKGRWRAMAMFGRFGQGDGIWAEGVYEMRYSKEAGVWKIATLDYHSGFGAAYETGWINTGPRRAGGRPALPHPADRARNMPCEGFPEACLAPFHYQNPGTSSDGMAWTVALRSSTATRRQISERASELGARAAKLRDEQDIENLVRSYGYYLDRRMWDQVADLFADDATIEMGLRGVYAGKERIRQFLDLLGPDGLGDGELNDRLQLQIIVSMSPNGLSAKSRNREFAMTGVHEQHGNWSAGIYENSFVKQDGVWKIRSLRFYPTFITEYEQGWTRNAQEPATVSTVLPPDRGPTELYEIYPKAHIPPYHYMNPVTGQPPQYPRREGRPSRRATRAATAKLETGSEQAVDRSPAPNVEAIVSEAERQIARVKDYHELSNLENAYGYYLDKNLWNDLADLFATEGSMQLAQRGVYMGRERVRGFLLSVFGRGGEGPVAGRLGNHLQMQSVIHIAPDGQSANIRQRMMQQLTFGPRASMGAAVYENAAVKENGVWKFSAVHAFNTWTAGYDGGWVKSPGGRVPGPSENFPPDAPPTLEFQMFPALYPLPFHYDNPVSGRSSKWLPAPAKRYSMKNGMPADIGAAVREIGPIIEPQRTSELYAVLQPAAPDQGVSIVRDLRYGRYERHKLDVFAATDNADNKPVVVFVHGGGFARGAKTSEGSPFYDNVMLWAAASGLVGVNINYRLAPEHTWPSGIEDLTAVVAWLKANISNYGGDAEKLFLWGHSAGAAHAADYVANAETSGRAVGLAGAILTSGFYDLGDELSAWQTYYGSDVARYAERSSLRGLTQSSLPLFVIDAELDPANFHAQAQKLAQARAEAGKPVRRLHLPGHSHISETYAVNTSDNSLSAPVLDFVNNVGTASSRE